MYSAPMIAWPRQDTDDHDREHEGGRADDNQGPIAAG
jgi:hypothetical protein